jgi:hypothetical protein
LAHNVGELEAPFADLIQVDVARDVVHLVSVVDQLMTINTGKDVVRPEQQVDLLPIALVVVVLQLQALV